jgi:hypothetical protein
MGNTTLTTLAALIVGPAKCERDMHPRLQPPNHPTTLPTRVTIIQIPDSEQRVPRLICHTAIVPEQTSACPSIARAELGPVMERYLLSFASRR